MGETDKVRIYFGGKFDNKLLISNMVTTIMNKFSGRIDCTSTSWLSQTKSINLSDRSKIDFDGLFSSDLAIFFAPLGYGSCSEMGFCLASNIPIIYVNDKVFQSGYIKYEFGCNDPLPVGLLGSFSDDEENEFGYIVTDIDELIQCVSYFINDYNFEINYSLYTTHNKASDLYDD